MYWFGYQKSCTRWIPGSDGHACELALLIGQQWLGSLLPEGYNPSIAISLSVTHRAREFLIALGDNAINQIHHSRFWFTNNMKLDLLMNEIWDFWLFRACSEFTSWGWTNSGEFLFWTRDLKHGRTQVQHIVTMLFLACLIKQDEVLFLLMGQGGVQKNYHGFPFLEMLNGP